ncbi:hypothetical protein GCM10028818_59360 [Spirosoma horti]
MENNPAINITRDPKSKEVSTEQDQTMLGFSREIVELTQKYGYEAFLISVTDQIEHQKGLLVSSAIGTLDPIMATCLLKDSIRLVQNLVQFNRSHQD